MMMHKTELTRTHNLCYILTQKWPQHYPSLGSFFTLTKQIGSFFLFPPKKSVLFSTFKSSFLFFPNDLQQPTMWYCHMNSGFINIIACDSYKSFQYLNFVFPQKCISESKRIVSCWNWLWGKVNTIGTPIHDSGI